MDGDDAMTVVLGVAGDRPMMAADSQASNDGMRHLGARKVVAGTMCLVGCSGSAGICQAAMPDVLRWADEYLLASPGRDLSHGPLAEVHRRAVEGLVKCDAEDEWGFVVVTHQSAWVISTTGYVERLEPGVVFVGAGGEAAYLAYRAMVERAGIEPPVALRWAIETAIRWVSGCGGSVQFEQLSARD